MKAARSGAEQSYYAGRQAYSLQAPQALFGSRDLFRRAVAQDPGLAKARALLAYTLVQAWLQGWSGESALNEARDEAEEALRLAPKDPYAHAQLGFYHLNTGHFAAALNYYRSATELPGSSDEIKVDRAEAEIYAGNIDIGIGLIQQAMAGKRPEDVPDWYRWDLAWAHFLKGREEAGSDEKAMQELDYMHLPPTDDGYMVDCLLLRAVVETRLRRTDAAKADLDRFLRRRTDWTLWREKRSVRFRRAADELYWLEGCRAAGLPG
jgi:tetratricopeptide (TPR) repeat protein